jgi:hypothetical protein
MFTIWDSENWEKTRKRIQVAYSDLEEKTTPVFPAGAAVGGSVSGGPLQGSGQGQSPGQTTQGPGQGQSGQTGVVASQTQSQQRESGTAPVGTPGGIPVGRFAGMGMSVGA